ncbi:histidine kinase/DNA gyrase B/HSP90-like ATPase [Aneurinibacillus soli]|uniref:Sensor histidine kinase YpdA n=2 Tax=Aneurinibacillus soli TaxID=1500254 RepID=A0A0U5B1C3_9BACL|nr:histidine kinase [Aneurinibacillus soli]PYE61988.1 histidine kinase/DNA gyrase B/HSP90-like ATPase [Aneurinibacillus soli]BAU29802.1 Sensor histidine kinase YpdA [Aneurinibacillus soli]
MNIIKDFSLQLAFIATLIFTFEIFFVERSERNNHVKIILAVLSGLSILLCMSFPVYVITDTRLDTRIVPLLWGTLYGGLRTGLFLSALIILYRFYLGGDLGFYTTILTLSFSMPVILFFQKFFTKAKKKKRIQIALILAIHYCLVGLIIGSFIRGFSFKVFQVQFIHIIIIVVIVLFFTSLNETIKEMIRKNQQLQSDAKDAEIAFLRSQIKPHFLYNALNSIAALCIDKPHKAEELTLDLSQYLRSSFDFKQLDSLTTIENELELVKAYINIEKARFGARLRVEYDVDANLDILIPPLILQPLVENAIRHGLMSNLRGGTVKISVKKEEDAVVSFTVEDNGCGMSGKKRDEILKSDVKKKGIGLWNISQRIQLQYGKSIRIESAEGIGTKVIFDIPARAIKQIGG